MLNMNIYIYEYLQDINELQKRVITTSYYFIKINQSLA